jgi:hypothetical protein
MSKLLWIAFIAACTSSASTDDDVTACESVGSAYCARAYACLSADQLSQYQLPATQAECVTQENANCGSATVSPGFCKGAAQTSGSAANACASSLDAESCSDFTSTTTSDDACKTELCAD